MGVSYGGFWCWRRNPEGRREKENKQLLAQIAKMTQGMLVPPTALEEMLSRIDLSPEITQDVQQRPLWDRWPFLWVFLGCLTIEWIVRKLTGLA